MVPPASHHCRCEFGQSPALHEAAGTSAQQSFGAAEPRSPTPNRPRQQPDGNPSRTSCCTCGNQSLYSPCGLLSNRVSTRCSARATPYPLRQRARGRAPTILPCPSPYARLLPVSSIRGLGALGGRALIAGVEGETSVPATEGLAPVRWPRPGCVPGRRACRGCSRCAS
jgi:hypothetical protein